MMTQKTILGAWAFAILASAACGDGTLAGSSNGNYGAGPGEFGNGNGNGALQPGGSDGDPGAADGVGPGSNPAGTGNVPGGVGSTDPGGAGQAPVPDGTPAGGGSAPVATTTPGAPPINAPIDPNADPSEPVEPLAQCDTPGPRMVRRLTSRQYHNTLVDLFGPEVPIEEVLSDPAALGFHVDSEALQVRDLAGELLMNHAEQVAAWAAQNKLDEISNHCKDRAEHCYNQFFDNFGLRLFRQPVSDAQRSQYRAMFEAEDSFEAGLSVVLSAMLQSPYFLYRQEMGVADPQGSGQYRLTPYEIATELSYFLTDRPPDENLLRAAAEGRLETPADIDREADRLLETEGARGMLKSFVEGWLEIDGLLTKAKDMNAFNLRETFRQSMLREAHEFFIDAVYNDGTVGDLFGAKHTFVDSELASLYGLNAGGNAFQRVSLEGSQRATGLLGQAAFLTQHALPDNSSPVQRGIIVRERILCQDLPPVPENLDTNLKTPTNITSNRDRYKQHSQDPQCYVCHAVIDPVGFSFESYDAFGRYRAEDMGNPVDASGELSGVTGGPVALNGLQDLNDYLAISDMARSCLVRYWSYYAYGRDAWDQKVCNHDAIRAEAAANGYTLMSTLKAILHAPHFTRRVGK